MNARRAREKGVPAVRAALRRLGEFDRELVSLSEGRCEMSMNLRSSDHMPRQTRNQFLVHYELFPSVTKTFL